MEQTWFGISNKIIYSAIALILLLWGIAGVREIAQTSYAGYNTSPDNIVTSVADGSPAFAAGLKIGDHVTKYEGISTDNIAALQRLPRQVPGTKGTITVQRGSAEQTLSITYGEQPTSELLWNQGTSILMGLACLLLGLLVYLRNPTQLSSMLCLLLFGLAVGFLPAPYIASTTVRGWYFSVLGLIGALTVALLLLYCLKFPRTKKLLADRPWLGTVIVVVPLLMGLYTAYLNLTLPSWSDSARRMLSIVFGIIYGGIFLCALLAILHSYVKADANERRALGLNWMLLGVVLGLVPIVCVVLVNIFLPHTDQTWGGRLINVGLLALPICFSLALMKREPVGQLQGEVAQV